MTGAREVVVTGVGMAVCGFGDETDLFREPGARTRLFAPETALTGRGMRHKDRTSKLALCSVEPALAQAGLVNGEGLATDPYRVAVVVSTNYGSVDSVCRFVDTIDTETVVGLSPMALPLTSSNMTAGWIAIRHGIRGPNLTVCNGPTSGLDAVNCARDLIAVGRADAAVVVGVEPANDMVARLLGMSADARAFDGAVAVTLESAVSAASREIRPRAAIAGYGRAGSTGAAVEMARGSAPRAVGLWLTGPSRGQLDGDLSDVRTFHLSAQVGNAAGAHGVLQCAAAVVELARDNRHSVLATCGGDGDDAAAALVFTSGGRR